MGRPPTSDPGPNKEQLSVAVKLVGLYVLILLLSIGVLLILAFFHRFYWDEAQERPIFLWDAFVFFLTVGTAATVVSALATFAGAVAGLARGKTHVSWAAILCGAGFLLTLVLWIKLQRDPEAFGEVSALADTAIVSRTPEARLDAVSGALNTLFAALELWWISTAGAALGLRQLATLRSAHGAAPPATRPGE